MAELMVVKRNGELATFDKNRIQEAIRKAFVAVNGKVDEKLLEEISDNILKELSQRFKDFYPNVENIQDIAEKQLMHHQQYEVAKAYILYRAKREEGRQEAKRELVEKSYLGKLQVAKRDGRKVIFDRKKLHETLKRARQGYENTITDDDLAVLSKEVIKNLYDGVQTHEIEDAMILASTSFIERDPAYSYVGSRLLRQKIVKEILQTSVQESVLLLEYKKSFIAHIKNAVALGILDQRMLNYDLEKMAEYLRPERDDLFGYMGLRTLYERYLLRTGEGELLELPQVFWMRVAMGLAIQEENPEAHAKKFYDTVSVLRYLPSTPTLFHSGTSHAQLSSCYLTTVTDDLNHIFKSYGDNANLAKWSGGIGNDWTNIRATGAIIKTTRVESQGVIPFLKIANDVTAAINRSGKRRGATCAYLETWHLDIEDFLDLRRNTGDERRRTHDMNTANWVPDLFMKRVLQDRTWTLFSPEEVPDLHHTYGKDFEKRYEAYEDMARKGKINKHKTISAKQLWRKMLSRLFETGHPWITFKDPCNIRSPQDHAGVIHSSNLCTEITLNTSEEETAVCNLGSVNLSRHVIDGALDRDLLADTVSTAMRMLDNVIDLNFYPTKEAETSNMRHRPVGLGVMGFQDMLFLMDVDFGTEQAAALADQTQEFISYHVILTSSKLAKEKGTYPSYEGSKWDRGLFPHDTIALLEEERGRKIDIPREESLDWSEVRVHVKQHGMRNSNTMAIAPTATISTIAGCFPSIEPIYKNIYVKANMSGEFTIVNSYLVEDLKKVGIWNGEMLDQIKYNDGNLSRIAAIPERLREKYKEAFEIDPRWCLRMNALRAKWIDQSQSHNVFMAGASGKLLSDIYTQAWELGLKTTYYLRTLAKSQIEKSTLDASKYGFTQKREVTVEQQVAQPEEKPKKEMPKLCRIEDPECEACQ